MNKNKYSIKVYYNDDSVKTLITHDDIDLARLSYQEAKEKYLIDNKVDSVELHIIFPNGKVTKYYQKEREISENKKFINANINKSPREIVNTIQQYFNTLLVMKDYYHDKLISCERKRSQLLHMIEATKNKQFETEESKSIYKIKLFDELELNEQQRRIAKNNHDDAKQILHNISIEDIQQKIGGMSIPRREIIETPEEVSEKINKVITYKTNREKDKYIRKYREQYDQVEWYKRNKKLIFIGHTGKGKIAYRNKPFQIIEKDYYTDRKLATRIN